MDKSSSGFRRTRFSAGAFLLGALLLAACGDNGPQTAASITLGVPATNLLVGQRVHITPTVKDGGGKVLTGRVITYKSSAPNVVVVSSEGDAVAMGVGAATITATVDAATTTVGFVVAPIPVNRVVVAPGSATIKAATSTQLSATPQDSAGNTLFDRVVTWSSSDTTVATVSASGLVSGVRAGSAVITATIEGKAGQAQLTITAPAVASIDISPASSRVTEGRSTQLTATARDANGRAIPGVSFTWRSSSTSVATVDNTGLVTGVAPGYVNIMASSGTAFGSAIVLVEAVVVGSVTTSPDSVRLDVGADSLLTATVYDDAGHVLTNKPVTWRSLNTAIAVVDDTGLVTAVATGSTGIVASREGKADTSIVAVNPLPVASITLTPTSANLGVGRSGPMVAVARDSLGNIAVQPVRWTLSDSTVATVDSTGTLTGVVVGNTTVYAPAGSKRVSATLSVVSTTVASVTVAANAANLSTGGTFQIIATPRAADLSALPNRLIRYTSVNPAVATVDGDGLVHGVAPVNTGISVNCEGQVAMVTIAVH